MWQIEDKIITSRDQKSLRRTSNRITFLRKGYRQGTFSSQPQVSVLTGAKVMAHYVVLYISGDLDLGPIFIKLRLWQLDDKTNELQNY